MSAIRLIDPSNLKSYLECVSVPVSIVDARPRAEFEAGHVPHAQHIAWEDWNEIPPRGTPLDLWEPGYWGALDNPWKGEFAQRLSAMGLSNQKTVVVYADGLRSKGREGRIAWMLLYLGCARVCILNGGWTAWVASGGEQEKVEVDPRKGVFRIQLDSRRRITMNQIGTTCGDGVKFKSIDTRSIEEFVGDSYDYQMRTGHLPQALRLGYEAIFKNDHEFVGADSFSNLISGGILNSPGTFTYCEVGVRASMYALLLEAYTGQIMPVYDGSVMEWGIYKDLPLLRE